MFLQDLSFELKVLVITLPSKDGLQFLVASLHHLSASDLNITFSTLNIYFGLQGLNYQYQAHPLKGAGPAAKR